MPSAQRQPFSVARPTPPDRWGLESPTSPIPAVPAVEVATNPFAAVDGSAGAAAGSGPRTLQQVVLAVLVVLVLAAAIALATGMLA